MPILQALYAQSPALVWLAIGALLIVLELAVGSGRLFWPAIAALGPAALDGLWPHVGAPVEVGAFAILAGTGTFAAARFAPGLAGGGAGPLRPSRPPGRTRARSSTPLNLDLGAVGVSPEPAPPRSGSAQAAEAPTPPHPARPRPPPIVQSVPPTPKPPRAKGAPPPPPIALKRTARPPVSDPAGARQLVGRIARSTGDFANGVGRVWIEGAEWGADLEYADELPADQPVQVTGVNGALRLRVRPLVIE